VCWFIFSLPRLSKTNTSLPSQPGSELRYRKVANCPEVADFVDAGTCPQKTTDINGLRYSSDDLTYRLGPFHVCLYVRLVTGTFSKVPWNGRGRKLVQLNNGC